MKIDIEGVVFNHGLPPTDDKLRIYRTLPDGAVTVGRWRLGVAGEVAPELTMYRCECCGNLAFPYEWAEEPEGGFNVLSE